MFASLSRSLSIDGVSSAGSALDRGTHFSQLVSAVETLALAVGTRWLDPLRRLFSLCIAAVSWPDGRR